MPRGCVRGLGETVLRVNDLAASKQFYEVRLRLELWREFDGMAFFRLGDGYGGHTQILGLFDCERPLSIPSDQRIVPAARASTLHHFAFEIDVADFEGEYRRLSDQGLSITTAIHRWCQWRSMYLHDPDGNTVELVCYDASIDVDD